MKRILIAALCASSVAPEAGTAQNKPVEFIKAVPNAPALSFLAVTPSKIERPGNLRDLGVAIMNGVGEDGKAQQGFVFDASVWNLIPGYDIPLDAYRKNPVKYAIANLQASLGTVRTAGDSADLMGAFGVKAVIFDRGDPMLDPKVTKALAAGMKTCVPDQPGEGQSVACVDSVAADIVGKYTIRHWNASQLAVAAAWGTRFDNAEFDKGSYAGMDGWLVGAVAVGTNLQLLSQATYKQRTAFDSLPGYRALNTGVRLIGGSSTFNGFIEVAREWRTPKENAQRPLVVDENVSGWSAGTEFRLAANTWISTGLGTQFTALGKSDRTVVFANVKWGISSESRINKLRQ